jgi:segregation and condensation protein B
MANAPPPPLHRILEALLFVGGAPLTPQRAAEVVRGLSEDDFHQAIDTLSRAYRSQGRPYQVQLQEHGYVLTMRSRFRSVREKLFGGVREARLSQAAVDVLSLVAYKQPATREEIDALRGADSGGVLRQLLRHGLVSLQRLDGDSESRYVTTPRFLQLFGLTSLDDLPQTQDLQRL